MTPRLRDQVRWTRPTHLLAFGFGTGLAPRAPGTVGTLLGVPLYLLMQNLAWPMYWAGVLVLFALGVLVCGAAARDLNVHDHPGIVWDEVVGILIALGFAPRGAEWIVAGFVVFRVFDIAKPWPVNVIDQRVHGGLGIMLDDAMAGVYAGLVLYLGARTFA
jgi:phosphatidylglycerophosphatase A